MVLTAHQSRRLNTTEASVFLILASRDRMNALNGMIGGAQSYPTPDESLESLCVQRVSQKPYHRICIPDQPNTSKVISVLGTKKHGGSENAEQPPLCIPVCVNQILRCMGSRFYEACSSLSEDAI